MRARAGRWAIFAAVLVVAAVAAAAALGSSQAIGPGTTLLRIYRPGPGGPIKAYVLRVDLANRGVRVGLLYPGSIAAGRTVSAMAADEGAFAGVNGDFFNIGATGAPVGPVVTGGQLIKAPQPGRGLAAGVGQDGIGRISYVRMRGFVKLPSGRIPLADVNDANPGYAPMLAPNGIGLFTPAWGSYTRAGAARGLSPVTEVLVRGGRVASIGHQAGSGSIAAGGYVLLGAGRGAVTLGRLRVGQRVSVQYGQSTASPFEFAIGGKYWLVRGGAVQSGLPASGPDTRTAVGFSADGRTMYLVVTGGRRDGVLGLSYTQLAQFMRSLGAVNAVNLDDGGSTTIVARLPGAHGLSLLNRPADGPERSVANGIGLFAGRS